MVKILLALLFIFIPAVLSYSQTNTSTPPGVVVTDQSETFVTRAKTLIFSDGSATDNLDGTVTITTGQAEADTLDSVVGRGATTTKAISVGTATVSSGNLLVSTGNVGIGTVSPAQRLVVKDTTAASTSIDIDNLNPAVAGIDGYVKAMLHFDGADTSTTITDSIGVPKTWTVSGGAQLKTDQKKFGTASLYMDGAGDYISTADSADWELGSGDYTIDFWVRIANYYFSDGGVTVFLQGQDVNNWHALAIDGAQLRYWVKSGGSFLLNYQPSKTMSTNTWYHIAIVRYGATVHLYVDGTELGTGVAAATVPNYSSSLFIGANALGILHDYNGYIDEFRWSKGIAGWTGNFDPPSSAYSAGGNISLHRLLDNGTAKWSIGQDGTDLVSASALKFAQGADLNTNHFREL
jgi:hypothetical protein